MKALECELLDALLDTLGWLAPFDPSPAGPVPVGPHPFRSRSVLSHNDAPPRPAARADVELSERLLKIQPSKLSLPDEIDIPVDTSIVSFAMLLSAIHSCQVELSNWPKQEDCLGNELLQISSLS